MKKYHTFLLPSYFLFIIFLISCSTHSEIITQSQEVSAITNKNKKEIEIKHHLNPMPKTYFYKCDDNVSFVARTEQQKIWLFLSTGTVQLKSRVSASGSKYGNDAIVFWSKGAQASLSGTKNIYRNCRNQRYAAIWEHAKLNGVSFKAIGNEPPWGLELSHRNGIVFTHGYDKKSYRFKLPEPMINQINKETRYTASNVKHVIKLKLKAKHCSDTMSDHHYETQVTVEFDNKLYNGCGKALHN